MTPVTVNVPSHAVGTGEEFHVPVQVVGEVFMYGAPTAGNGTTGVGASGICEPLPVSWACAKFVAPTHNVRAMTAVRIPRATAIVELLRRPDFRRGEAVIRFVFIMCVFIILLDFQMR